MMFMFVALREDERALVRVLAAGVVGVLQLRHAEHALLVLRAALSNCLVTINVMI